MKWATWLEQEKQRAELKYSRYQVNKFFNNLEMTFDVVDTSTGKALVHFVYNEKAPELSYILMSKYEPRN